MHFSYSRNLPLPLPPDFHVSLLFFLSNFVCVHLSSSLISLGGYIKSLTVVEPTVLGEFVSSPTSMVLGTQQVVSVDQGLFLHTGYLCVLFCKIGVCYLFLSETWAKGYNQVNKSRVVLLSCPVELPKRIFSAFFKTKFQKNNKNETNIW